MVISEDIIRRLAEGDHEAFRSVFKMFYPKVYAFASGFTKNADDAEDVAQTVFIRLWMRREQLAKVGKFDSYLYVITKNIVLNSIAAKKGYSVDLSCVRNLYAKSPSAQENIEAEDLRLLVDLIVSNMPQQRQTVYRMSREEGLTNDEIAQQLGIQKKTVENHLNLALKEIRNSLSMAIFLLSCLGVNVNSAVYII